MCEINACARAANQSRLRETRLILKLYIHQKLAPIQNLCTYLIYAGLFQVVWRGRHNHSRTTCFSPALFFFKICWVGNRLLHVSITRVKFLHLLRRWESKQVLLREPRLQYHSTKETKQPTKSYSFVYPVDRGRRLRLRGDWRPSAVTPLA